MKISTLELARIDICIQRLINVSTFNTAACDGPLVAGYAQVIAAATEYLRFAHEHYELVPAFPELTNEANAA